jgi:outer membrane protein assembly factor BamE (lipoprotein component of BamABCDE complex)
MKILKNRIGSKVRYVFLIASTLMAFLGSSCSPVSRISGYVPSEIEISDLRIGSSTKEDAIMKLGEPLTDGSPSANFLLYVQKRVEIIAFLRPRIDDRKVVKLTFDDRSILSGIDFYDEVADKVFESDKKIVVSEGRKLTFWQQMFGNIGNFSSEQFFE